MSGFGGPIKHVPGPWKLKGDAHVFFTYSNDSDVNSLSKSFLYEPLEATSEFSEGRFVGGLAAAYIIRYHESPVGPYDELIIIPGSFESERNVVGKIVKERKLRITRIYVSTKATCYNGRKSMSFSRSRRHVTYTPVDWNIPKHLARFEFETLENGQESVTVFPEGSASKTPLFKTVFKPVAYGPVIPASTNIAKYIGLDLTHIQPPLSQGETKELVGTDEWCSFLPVVSSSRTSLEWWDLKQSTTENDPLLGSTASDGDFEVVENWWPGSSRWKIGVKMENADIDFPVGEHWRA